MAARERHRQPAREEKMVISINGLAIAALAESGQILGDPEFVTWAKTAAERLWTLAYDQKTGALKHEVFRGQAKTGGFLQDYASPRSSFMTLFDVPGGKICENHAQQLADHQVDLFAPSDA